MAAYRHLVFNNFANNQILHHKQGFWHPKSRLMNIITGKNEVLAKVIFSHLSVILFTGGGLARRPPCWKENPPSWMENPPGWMESPPPAGRRTPSAGWRTHPPPTGRRTPPAGWRPPQLEGEPPRLEGEPPGWKETPPREADSGIRSTIGRYASYWNAFLLKNMCTITSSKSVDGVISYLQSVWKQYKLHWVPVFTNSFITSTRLEVWFRHRSGDHKAHHLDACGQVLVVEHAAFTSEFFSQKRTLPININVK